jgi:hypothetical protein
VCNVCLVMILPNFQFLQVCDNVGDHLIGNVYARYEWETEAQAAVDNCNERWYAGEFELDTSWYNKVLSANS